MKLKFKSIVAAALSGIMMVGTIPAVPQIEADAATVCTINLDKEYQTIAGFGGINHPEWAGDLTDSQRATAFGTGKDQLGLSVLRIFINPDKNQWSKAVATAKYAVQHGVTVFASPWEPPSNLAEGGGAYRAKLHLPERNYGAYAQHLNDFGNYMKSQGVNLYAISIQNEPDFPEQWTGWTSDETTKFLAEYGDKITSAKVMSPESYQYSPANASWIANNGGKNYYTKILKNQKAFANTDLFGTHFYGTQRGWMDFPELESCGKQIWMTEVYHPNSDKNSNSRWPEAIEAGEIMHDGLVVGNMSAFVWWYIRRNYSPMNEDGSISKRGYIFGQYSKFIRPGDIRVDCTEMFSNTNRVRISAYKSEEDGQVKIVAINNTDSEISQQFDIGQNISDITRYRTSANENWAPTTNIKSENGAFWSQLPARSVSTFVVDLASGAIVLEPDENGYWFHDTFEGDNCGWSSHGSTEVELSGRSPYAGSEALLGKSRASAWNGIEKSLNSKIFKAGTSYSFSVDACVLDSDVTSQTASLTLQYKNASGETTFAHIADATLTTGNYVQLANPNFKLPEDGSDFVIYVETDTKDNIYIDEAIGAVAGTKIDGPAEIQTTTTTTVTTTTTTATTTTTSQQTTTTTTAAPTTTTEAPVTTRAITPTVYGDADLNNFVSVADIVMVLQYAANHTKYPLSDQALANCDVNSDGEVNATDAYIIQMLDSGEITSDQLPLKK